MPGLHGRHRLVTELLLLLRLLALVQGQHRGLLALVVVLLLFRLLLILLHLLPAGAPLGGRGRGPLHHCSRGPPRRNLPAGLSRRGPPHESGARTPPGPPRHGLLVLVLLPPSSAPGLRRRGGLPLQALRAQALGRRHELGLVLVLRHSRSFSGGPLLAAGLDAPILSLGCRLQLLPYGVRGLRVQDVRGQHVASVAGLQLHQPLAKALVEVQEQANCAVELLTSAHAVERHELGGLEAFALEQLLQLLRQVLHLLEGLGRGELGLDAVYRLLRILEALPRSAGGRLGLALGLALSLALGLALGTGLELG
mmetsp:Transcript_32396/g.76880  ORF Transcript_32396/g.76880 Transcript_32396/m.76880 type:complete len:310 (-) Transcript_32396:571-1500(-)